MKKALVIFGGVSSEHAVSCVSARFVADSIPKDQYEVLLLGITEDGAWYLYEGDTAYLPEDKWQEDMAHCTKAVLSPDRKDGGLLVFRENGVENVKIDVIFPVLHGKHGEDGTMQGLFALSGIPYVGGDTLSSAMCMDKAVTNLMMDSADIAQAKWLATTHAEYEKDAETFLKAVEQTLGFPVFVKPANAGSSVGVSKAENVAELKTAMDIALREDKKVVVEESINGLEIECAVLGNENPVPSEIGAILPKKAFYDYEAKYLDDSSELQIPAQIPEEKQREVQEIAVKVYKTLGCRGLSRVDFFLERGTNRVLLNEINTLPGFTAISMYPKLTMRRMSAEQLLTTLLDLAQEQ